MLLTRVLWRRRSENETYGTHTHSINATLYLHWANPCCNAALFYDDVRTVKFITWGSSLYGFD